MVANGPSNPSPNLKNKIYKMKIFKKTRKFMISISYIQTQAYIYYIPTQLDISYIHTQTYMPRQLGFSWMTLFSDEFVFFSSKKNPQNLPLFSFCSQGCIFSRKIIPPPSDVSMLERNNFVFKFWWSIFFDVEIQIRIGNVDWNIIKSDLKFFSSDLTPLFVIF